MRATGALRRWRRVLPIVSCAGAKVNVKKDVARRASEVSYRGCRVYLELPFVAVRAQVELKARLLGLERGSPVLATRDGLEPELPALDRIDNGTQIGLILLDGLVRLEQIG